MKGKSSEKACLLTSQYIIRNDEGFFSPSLIAQNSVEKITPNNSAIYTAKDRFTVSPHVLRHTFLRKLAETKGVQYAKEASGHKTDRYIWRYVKPDQQTLAAAIDALE